MADELNATEMRKSGGSRLNEILKRSREDNELSSDTPDIYFDYEDTDTYQGEMSELYSYTEEEEFVGNKECFQQLFHLRYPEGTLWWSLKDQERRDEVLRFANLLEVANKDLRLQAIRALLYLIQGTFAECSSKPSLNRASTRKEDKRSSLNNNDDTNNINLKNEKNEQQKSFSTNKMHSKNLLKTPKKALFTLDEHTTYVAKNTVLLYHCGIFQTCTQLLNMEISCSTNSNGTSVSLSDNKELRYLLSILYSMLEAIRFQLTPEVAELKEDLKADLVMCLPNYNDSLIMTLFGMVTQFCEAHPCHFPIKKVLLLLWKSLLLILGGLDDAFALKNETRLKQGLPLLTEDPHEVCRNMRSSSPPASAVDLIKQHQQQHRGGRAALRKLAARQGSMEDDAIMSSVDEDGIDGVKGMLSDDEDNAPPIPPRPASPLPPKALPWLPKVRKKDLEAFLYQTRSKFIGFHVDKDVQSLFGLPHPIHEGVEVFKQRLYVSLSEVQTQKEEDLVRNPLSMSEGTVEQTPSEVLYQAIYQTLPSYNIALLKVLLAAAPTSKAKSDNINILADLLPEKMPTSVLHSMKLGIDVNRHKEIIVKALSAILILLLKHFKINHFYQFEFMAQHLVFANCIPLVLKFMNQNIHAHICAKNNISMIDFPLCVIGETPELDADNLEMGDNEEYCWRNLFSSINLLRVLNKITKWKHSRIVLLVAFKSAPILKRALKVRQPMHQMYVLKLLKMQTKYLGRQWRKSNMKCMSAIYQKVRHRLNDDWAYGNDVDARPWDFQSEESVAKTAIDQFNQRRYQNPKDSRDSGVNNNSANATSVPGSVSILNDFTPVDNCLLSVLSSKVELSREFEENYEEWLECEVFAQKIDWNQFLLAPAVKN